MQKKIEAMPLAKKVREFIDHLEAQVSAHEGLQSYTPSMPTLIKQRGRI